ncbi:MAG: glycosyltransferase [Candidatus Omnitrophica bacterium]|nr:glycosyltransferase [Candidatus Omnitrophota bacterium]
MAERPHCDLILVSHDRLEYTTACLESLIRCTSPHEVEYRLLLLDNGSQHEVVEYLRGFQTCHPSVRLVLNAQNLGWVKAVNQGIQWSTAPYICWLNNDLLFTEGWLTAMLKVACHDARIGVVNPSWKLHHETPEMFQRRMARQRREGGTPYREIGECNGACMLVRREVINRIGLLDEIYGSGGLDDSDFSRRATRAGFLCVQANDAFVFHWENVTSNTVPGYWLRERPRTQRIFEERWGRPRQVAVVIEEQEVLSPAFTPTLRIVVGLARFGIRLQVFLVGRHTPRLQARWREEIEGQTPHANLRVRLLLLSPLVPYRLARWLATLQCLGVLASHRQKGELKRFKAVVALSEAVARFLQRTTWLHGVPVSRTFECCEPVAGEMQCLHASMESSLPQPDTMTTAPSWAGHLPSRPRPRAWSARLEKLLLKGLTGYFRPRTGTRRFGWAEALGFGSALDYWMRYASVIERLNAWAQCHAAGKTLLVLDVGGGPSGLISFVRDPRYRIVAVDPQQAVLQFNQAIKVAGDGCCLPFGDRTCDVVVSVDSLEHVPAERRLAFLKELNRVTNHLILLHCPLDSYDRRFQGTRYDKLFQRLHRRYFHQDEANTAEHLQWGLPTVELIQSVFPHADVEGLQNGRVWVRHMMGGRRPWRRIVNGLYYLWMLKRHDGQPPFHGALMRIERATSTRQGVSRVGRARLSVVVLTRNEEARIARCLAHVSWADEIIVVDGESTDRTAEICRRVGATVISRPFSGSFAEERNAGLEAATGDWVLQLDADDVVTPAMREEVTRVLCQDDGRYDVYKFRRRSVFLGHRLAFGAWTHYLPHLVRRKTVRYAGRVHEHPIAPEPFGVIDADVDHYFCERFADYLEKLNRYSSLSAQDLWERPTRLTPWGMCRKVALRPVKLFWKVYVRKQGYRDGIHGLIMALQNSWSHVVTYAKYWELTKAPMPSALPPDLTVQLDRLNQDSSDEAQRLWRSGPQLTPSQIAWRLWLAPPAAFWKAYLARRCYRDGWRGIVISALAAYQCFATYAKYWETLCAAGAPHQESA